MTGSDGAEAAQVVVGAPEGLQRIVAGLLHVAEDADGAVAEGDGVPGEPEVVDAVVLRILPHGVAVDLGRSDGEAEADVEVQVTDVLGLVGEQALFGGDPGLVADGHDARTKAELEVIDVVQRAAEVRTDSGADLGTDVGPGVDLQAVVLAEAGGDEQGALRVDLAAQVFLGLREHGNEDGDQHGDQFQGLHESLPPWKWLRLERKLTRYCLEISRVGV